MKHCNELYLGSVSLNRLELDHAIDLAAETVKKFFQRLGLGMVLGNPSNTAPFGQSYSSLPPHLDTCQMPMDLFSKYWASIDT